MPWIRGWQTFSVNGQNEVFSILWALWSLTQLLNSVLMVGIDDKQFVICKQIDVAMFQQTFIDQKQLRPIGHSLPIPCLRLMAL